MSQSAPAWFRTIFGSEVFTAYQRGGHNLRSFSQYKTGVRGQVVQFDKVGKGKAGVKPRHGTIPVMNLDFSKVQATMEDRYAGEWVDAIDEMLAADRGAGYRAPVANALSLALNREADDIFVNVLKQTTTTPVALETATANGMRNSLIKLLERFVLKEIDPVTSEVFVLPCPQLTSFLLTLKEYTNAEYVDVQTPYAGITRRARNWLGFRWLPPYTALPKAGNVVTMYAWERNAVGFGEVQGITTDVSWEATRAAWFFSGSLSMGGTIIENLGIEPFTLDTSAALPTT